MKELSTDPCVMALQEQSMLEPENRQTLLVRTNNCVVPGSDVVYPAVLNELVSKTSSDGSLESLVAAFFIVDGVNKIIPFKASLSNNETIEFDGKFEKRVIKDVRPLLKKPAIEFKRIF